MPIHLVKVLQNENLQICADDLVSEIRLPKRKCFHRTTTNAIEGKIICIYALKYL